MTQIAALAKALLSGEVISIKNAYFDYGISNISREIGRSIERKFHVEVSRVKKEGISRYGQPIVWFEYRLNRTNFNSKGITDMAKYILENGGNPKSGAKTKKQLNEA
jgi:hypothetical protein